MDKRLAVRILGVATALFLVRSGDVLADNGQCEGTADCGRQGDGAYKRHDYQSAIAFYQQQMQHSEEDLENCLSTSSGASEKACDSITTIAYNNLALANLHAGQAAKAQMWLSVAPPGARTEFNKRLVAASLATRHWPSSFEGEYWSYAGSGLWSTVKVVKKEGLYDISFEGFWVTALGALGAPHTGSLQDVVPIRRGVAILRSKEEPQCTVTARFKANLVELSGTEDCNLIFGGNVHAEGVFPRVSSSSG